MESAPVSATIAAVPSSSGERGGAATEGSRSNRKLLRASKRFEKEQQHLANELENLSVLAAEAPAEAQGVAAAEILRIQKKQRKLAKKAAKASQQLSPPTTLLHTMQDKLNKAPEAPQPDEQWVRGRSSLAMKVTPTAKFQVFGLDTSEELQPSVLGEDVKDVGGGAERHEKKKKKKKDKLGKKGDEEMKDVKKKKDMRPTIELLGSIPAPICSDKGYWEVVRVLFACVTMRPEDFESASYSLLTLWKASALQPQRLFVSEVVTSVAYDHVMAVEAGRCRSDMSDKWRDFIFGTEMSALRGPCEICPGLYVYELQDLKPVAKVGKPIKSTIMASSAAVFPSDEDVLRHLQEHLPFLQASYNTDVQSFERQVEQVRSTLEKILIKNKVIAKDNSPFQVEIFGSCCSGLNDPSQSDIDMTIITKNFLDGFDSQHTTSYHLQESDQPGDTTALFAELSKVYKDEKGTSLTSVNLFGMIQLTKQLATKASKHLRNAYFISEAVWNILSVFIDFPCETFQEYDEISMNLIRTLHLDINEINMASVAPAANSPSSSPNSRARGRDTKEDKVFYRLKSALQRGGFSNIELILHARVPVAKFCCHLDRGQAPIDCDLIMNNCRALYNSRLIKTYWMLDASGKVKAFLMLVKKFAKSSDICDASSDSLSSYAWIILALHVLLRFEYLPNIQPCEPIDLMRGNKRIDLRFNTDLELPMRFVEKLETTNILCLFRLFVTYYSNLDIEFQCITLRSSQELGAVTIPKNSWPMPKRWRISIEDPFEHVDSFKPHDLGTTVTSQAGQLKIKNALERAMRIMSVSQSLLQDVSSLFGIKGQFKSSSEAPKVHALTHIVVLDFEATCFEDNKDHEIIEFPSVVIDLSTFEVVDRLEQFVKPVRQPILSEFCKSLTTITQEQVDQGVSLRKALETHYTFCRKYPSSILATCGDWDLKTMLPADCNDKGVSIPKYYRKWINLKDVFQDVHPELKGAYKNGMDSMLRLLGLELKGTYHRGIDDCENIAQIIIKLHKEGWRMR